MIPNCLHIVNDLRARFPEKWRNAHTGNAHTEDFIRHLAWVLHSTVDARFGLLGQRGNPNVIGDDVVLWTGEGPGRDPLTGAAVSAFDVIVRAGDPSQEPGWGFINQGGEAAWVKPTPVGDAQPAPPPTSDIWTAAHEAIRARMAGRSVRNLAEQLAHTFPDEQWGEKRTTSGGWSADTIGRLVGGRLWAVRVIPAVTIFGFLDGGHVHRPVPAVNHLGDVAPPPPPPVDPIDPPPPPPPAASVDLAPVLDAIKALSAQVDALHRVIDAQRQEVLAAVRGQSYDIDANVRMLGPVRGTITPRQENKG